MLRMDRRTDLQPDVKWPRQFEKAATKTGASQTLKGLHILIMSSTIFAKHLLLSSGCYKLISSAAGSQAAFVVFTPC